MNILKMFKEKSLLLFVLIFSFLSIFALADFSVGVALILFSIFAIFYLSIEDSFIYLSFITNFCIAFRYFGIIYYLVYFGFIFLTIKTCIVKKDKINAIPKKLKIILLICLLYLVIQPWVYLLIHSTYMYITKMLRLYAFLCLFIFVFLMKGEISFKRFSKYYSLGVVVSCLMSVVAIALNRWDLPLTMYNDADGVRFLGLYENPNQLVRPVVLVMVFATINLFSNYKQIFNYALIVIMLPIGFATGSKSFLILLAVYLLLVLAYMVFSIKNKKIVLAVVLGSTVLVALSGMIFLNQLKFLLQRFTTEYNEGGDLMDKITTGRVEIWKEYLKVYLSSPVYIIFGASIFRLVYPKINIVHNMYISILFQYGIVGVLILCVFMIMILKCIKGLKKDFKWYIPIILILISGLIEDHIFSSFGVWFILISILFVCKDNKDFKNVKIENQNKLEK